MADMSMVKLEALPTRRSRGRIAGVSAGTWVGVVLLLGASSVGLAILLHPSLRELWTDQSLRETFLPPASPGHLLAGSAPTAGGLHNPLVRSNFTPAPRHQR